MCPCSNQKEVNVNKQQSCDQQPSFKKYIKLESHPRKARSVSKEWSACRVVSLACYVGWGCLTELHQGLHIARWKVVEGRVGADLAQCKLHHFFFGNPSMDGFPKVINDGCCKVDGEICEHGACMVRDAFMVFQKKIRPPKAVFLSRLLAAKKARRSRPSPSSPFFCQLALAHKQSRYVLPTDYGTKTRRKPI